MPSGRSNKKDEFMFGGKPVVGWSGEMLLNTLTRALDRVVMVDDDDLARRDSNRPSVLRVRSAGELIGTATGLAVSGVRAGAMVPGKSLSSIEHDLALASRLHIPLTVFTRVGLDDGIVGKSMPPTAFSNGDFSFFAGTVQETVDLALIAIRVAERALLPGICAQDVIRSRYDVSNILSLEDELVTVFLGTSDERIDAATPSQRMTLGSSRRRVPSLVSHHRPAGLNPRYTSQTERLIEPAHVAFFESHLGEIIEDAFDDFGSLTGRFYKPIDAYRTADAEYVVVTIGAAGERVKPIIDYLRRSSRLRIGGVRIRTRHPLAESELLGLLGDKRAVTVLDSSLSGARDLSRALRSALGREGPSLKTFAMPFGLSPSTGDWLAAIDQMTSAETGRGEFFVIPPASASRARVPDLEHTDQVLRRDYPSVPWLSASVTGTDDPLESRAVRVFGKKGSLAAEATGTIARIYSSLQGVVVESVFLGGQPAECSVSLNSPTGCTAVLDAHLLRIDAVLNRMTPESVVIVPSAADKKQFWTNLPEVFRQTAIDRNLAVFTVDALNPDAEDDNKELDEHASVYALLGATFRAVFDGDVSINEMSDRLEQTLAKEGLPEKVASHLARSLSHGFNTAERVSRSEALARTPKAPETPWTLSSLGKRDDTVFDPARFWSAIGYESAAGRTNLMSPDPYLASRIVPGQTSVVSGRRAESPPQWLPENCTACGLCWTFCPHSALPVTVASTSEFIDAVRSTIESRGGSTTQVQRLGKHVAKRMHKLVADDGLHRFTSLNSLCEEAVEQLLDAAGLDEESEKNARDEFGTVIAEIGPTKISRTQPYFEIPEDAKKGTGRLLSVAIDPDACTSCGICAAVCPDSAIDKTPAEETPAEDLRHARSLCAAVQAGAAPIAATEGSHDRELADKLTSASSYYAALGGGYAAPGSGTRMALHLVAAVAESLAQPHRQSLLTDLAELDSRLKDRIRALLSKSLEINDFNEFAGRLRDLSQGADSVDVRDLLRSDSDDAVDTTRLQRLSDALLELESLRDSLNRDGHLASGLVAVFGDAPTILGDIQFPLNPFPFPWISAGSGDALALARGILDGLSSEALDAISMMRRANRLADDTFDPNEDISPSLDSLTDHELGILPSVCLFTERLDTDALHRIDGQDRVQVFWIDGLDGLSDTSVSSLPVRNPNVAVSQTAPADPAHFHAAVEDALSSTRSSLVRIHAPEPERHEFPTDQTVDRMRRAVEARVFPFFTYRPDDSKEWTQRWSLDGNPDATGNWNTEDGNLLTPAHWMAVEGRFASQFELLPRASWDDSQVPLAEYLDKGAVDRNGLTPYVEIEDSSGRLKRLGVAAGLVDVSEQMLGNWRLLQEMAGVRSGILEVARKQVEEELRVQMDAERQRLTSESEARIQEIRAGYDQELRERLTARLLAMSGFSGSAGSLQDWLSAMEEQGRTIHADSPDAQDNGG